MDLPDSGGYNRRMSQGRRSLLKIGSAAVAASFVPGVAMALRVEELDVPRQRLLLAACETRNTHQRVLADLIREMEVGGADAEQARAKAAAANCPFCGCNLAALDLPADGETPKF